MADSVYGGTQRQQALEAIKAAGENGLRHFDLVNRLGCAESSARRITQELRRLGQVRVVNEPNGIDQVKFIAN